MIRAVLTLLTLWVLYYSAHVEWVHVTQMNPARAAFARARAADDMPGMRAARAAELLAVKHETQPLNWRP